MSDGEQAGREYLKILEGQVNGADKAAIIENLEKYCGMDTEAMIWILRVLEITAHALMLPADVGTLQSWRKY